MREPKILVSQELLKLIAEIDEFKGKWEVLKTLSPERLTALRRVATIESVGSSTRIEGAKLTDLQVETLLANLKTTSFKTRDEQEVAGYAEAMDLVFEAWADLRITENHIRQLHKILLKHSSKDEHHRGEYKKQPNRVVARDESGKEVAVVFEPSTPFDTPREMEELVHWVNKAIAEEVLHPLLIVGVFVVVFLAIHPFEDGNGRLSRILTTLLLMRLGYNYVPYASLESIVEDNKDSYYQALRRTQTSLKKDEADWEPWLGFFLRCLKKQKNNLATKVEQEKARTYDLSDRILEVVRTHERLTPREMVSLTGGNLNTIRLHLRKLTEAGKIQRNGKGRATWYSKL